MEDDGVLVIILLIAVPTATCAILGWRLMTYRKNPLGQGPRTYTAYDGPILIDKAVSPDLYTERGQRLIPWFRVSMVALALAYGVAGILILRWAATR